VALVERGDFASGTSSRSTKLIHGGVRYLQRGQVALVAEALRERGRLCRNAPGLIRDIPLVVPTYRWWEKAYFGTGLKLYHALSGKWRMGHARFLSRPDTVSALPTIVRDRLRGGVVYHDAQFDDARLAIALAATAARHGAVVVNYASASGLTKRGGNVRGVTVRDEETGESFDLPARVVINATGVFTDEIRKMDNADAQPIIRPSRGIHLVVDRRFMPGDAALLVPNTDDSRVLFIIPWHNRVLIGTTDTPVDRPVVEPTADAEEIDYLLVHAARYLSDAPARGDVLSVFAGLRPLVGADDARDTSAISREHVVRVSSSGLVTLSGGKWTTYRTMAEDAVDQAVLVGSLDPAPSRTADMPLACATPADNARGATIDPDEDTIEHAVTCEMARTTLDILARRTRSLLLDARVAAAAAPRVSRAVARLLGRDDGWRERDLDAVRSAVRSHLPPDSDKAL